MFLCPIVPMIIFPVHMSYVWHSRRHSQTDSGWWWQHFIQNQSKLWPSFLTENCCWCQIVGGDWGRDYTGCFVCPCRVVAEWSGVCKAALHFIPCVHWHRSRANTLTHNLEYLNSVQNKFITITIKLSRSRLLTLTSLPSDLAAYGFLKLKIRDCR